MTDSTTRNRNLIFTTTRNLTAEWLFNSSATKTTSCKNWEILCNTIETLGTVRVARPYVKEYNDYWDLVTNTCRMYFQIINFVIICQIIDLFGTVTNIINIIVFVKQGFKDPVNISFLGLTISDLISLVILVWNNISVNPLLYNTDIPFDPEQTAYMIGGIPHMTFARVTACITAFITLERCLCITHPLKVKNFFTRRRVFFIISFIYIIIIGSNFGPAFYTIPFMLVKHPYLNRTWLSLEFTSYRRPVEKYAFAINSIFIPFSAFALVVICTVIFVVKLKKTTNWRKKSSTVGQNNGISNRDRSVSKMIVMLSTIFIICYTPVCIIFIAMIIEPKLSIDGAYGNVFAIVFSFAFLLESINASVNIFVYYKASSRYKAVFCQIFCISQSKENTATIRDTSSAKLEKI